MAEEQEVVGVAVDIGNSKSDVAVVSVHPTNVAWVRSVGSFTPQSLGWRGCAETIVAHALRADGSQHSHFEAVHVAAAGVDFVEDEHQLHQALVDTGRFSSIHVTNDTYALLASGGGAQHGVCVVAGAGMNCLAVSGDREIRFPALGEISGDWGGGRDIGLAALAAACRAEDGRGRSTRLVQTVPKHFGMHTPSEVTLLMYRGAMAVQDLIPLAETVFAAAGDGDDVASRILDRQAEEVAAFITAAHNRLGLVLGDVPVVLGGSILRLGGPAIHDRIRRFLGHDGIEFTIPSFPPIIGVVAQLLANFGEPTSVEELAARFPEALRSPRRES